MRGKIFLSACVCALVLLNACSKENAVSVKDVASSIEVSDEKTEVESITTDEKINEEAKEPIGLSKEAVLTLAKKENLSIEDIEEYVGSIDLQTGSFFENYLFDWDGIPVALRVIASDGSVASKPYDNILDNVVLFKQDFMDLDTQEKEMSYEGTCADIRHGDIEHIISGNIPMSDYLDIKIPNGYTLSNYKYWIGTHGGAYVFKDGDEADHGFENSGYTAEEESLGGVEIAMVSEPIKNSSAIDKYEDIQTDGITIVNGLYEVDATGHRYYLAYTEKENSQITFCFYLNPNYFTEDEFKTMLSEISFRENAIY